MSKDPTIAPWKSEYKWGSPMIIIHLFILSVLTNQIAKVIQTDCPKEAHRSFPPLQSRAGLVGTLF